MRKFFGFVLLVAGLAFGAFAFYPEAIDREARLAELTAIVAAPAGGVTRNIPNDKRAATTGSIPTFAPPGEIHIPKTVPPSTDRRDVADATMKPSAAPADLAPPVLVQGPRVAAAPAPAPSTGWQAIVTQEPGTVPTGVKSSKPGDGHARYELVMNLQRELKRIGCYGGTLNGSWNANTKRAMSAFMERVNSTLPMEEPDYILLTLLRGNANATCAGCPQGQVVSDGRCVPKAIIAHSARKDRRPEVRSGEPGFTSSVAVAEADASPAARPAPLPGRMSMGGPRSNLPPAPVPAPAVNGWNIKLVPQARVPAAGTAGQPPVREPDAAGSISAAPVKPAQDATKAAASTGIAGTVALVDPSQLPPVDAAAVDAAPPQNGAAPGPADATATEDSAGNLVAPEDVQQRARRPAQQRARSNGGKPQRAYGGNRSTRSVQSLFQHPLGRM